MSDPYDQRPARPGQTSIGQSPDVAALEAENAALRRVARLLLHGAGPDRSNVRGQGPWAAAVYPVEHLRLRTSDWAEAGQHTFWLTNAEIEDAARVLETLPDRPEPPA